MRMSLYIDDKLFIGASYSVYPKTDAETIELLEVLIATIKAPKVPYSDIIWKEESIPDHIDKSMA